MTAVSIGCAVAAALLFAISAALQQSVARTASLAAPARGPARWLPALALLRRLAGDRLWLAGWVANVGGFVLHAVALHLGSIGVVQALMTLQLLFALPLARLRHRARRTRPRDWVGTGLVSSGLVTLIASGVPASHPRDADLPLAAVVAVVAIGTLLGLARLAGRRAQLRSALVAIAAGCCFCCTAVQVVVITATLPHLGWAIVGLALSTGTGGLLVQDAFASGSLPTALTSMTVTDPVLSYLAGVALFRAVIPPGAVPLLVVAAGLVVAGVTVLANSPTLHDERGSPPSSRDDGDPPRSSHDERDPAPPHAHDPTGPHEQDPTAARHEHDPTGPHGHGSPPPHRGGTGSPLPRRRQEVPRPAGASRAGEVPATRAV